MVLVTKEHGALAALHTVLVLARFRALNGESGVAAILDTAEHLVRLLGSKEDATDEFRENIRGLAESLPQFRLALDRFDNPPENW